MTHEVLKRYGLTSLIGWAGAMIIHDIGPEQFMLELWKRPEFHQRFPAIQAREKAGLPPLNPEQYLEYERVAASLGSTWGLKLSKAEVDNLLVNDVSPQELEQRFTIAGDAVYNADAETKAELGRLFNISTGNLMRYWMDPKKELGALQNQYRMGELAGAALRTSWGQLNQAQAQRLMESGMDRESATAGFQQMMTMKELFTPLDESEENFTINDEVEFLAGDAAIANRVERQAERRAAEFQGTGGYAGGREGFATGTAD